MTDEEPAECEDYMPKGGLNFVWTIVKGVTDAPLPFALTASARFNRTPTLKVARQNELLSQLGLGGEARFEAETITTPTPNGSTTALVPLDQSDFRYYCLEFSGWAPPSFHDVAMVAQIMEPPLHFSHHVYSSEPYGAGEDRGFGHQLHFPRGVQERWGPRQPVQLDANYLAELGRNAQLFVDLQSTSNLVKNAMNLYRDLNNVPPNHPLRFLGLIAVLECVLCHKPKVADNADSLGHQIRTKIALLDSRPNAAIPALGSTPLERTWSDLYGLRSSIAHGDSATFPFKALPFQELGDAVSFVDATCRAVLRHLLTETALIHKLRAV
jgi:hypothetical protein